MKKLIICIFMMLALGVNNSSTYAQSVVRNGNTFKVESSGRSSSSKADTLLTSFKFEDSKGTLYPIIVNKQSGRCYVWKKSGKTGKMYKQYMNEYVSKTVCDELGITYVPKKAK